ncbi:ribitol 5-phosphate transferase FKRP-like [Rhopilema esculentum]|uniref:ribitol 5-phosphate transferase FKRP-like n=1 Tax=Rhopilema esculentum TaxID=499914 RepID=UPI0031DB3DF7
MKPSRCQCVLLLLILVNLAILAYFINNNKSWPKVEQEFQKSSNDVDKTITVVIYDFEHFENDIRNTVKSFLAFHPAINIIVVSDELPYPPIDLPAGNSKLVVLNVPPYSAAAEGRPLTHIRTEYTLFVPDSFHLRDESGLVRMLDSLVSTESRSPIVAAGAQGQNEQVPECNKLTFDYRRWTLKYSDHQEKPPVEKDSNTCESVDGKVAVLMRTSKLQKFASLFVRPFLKGLFIQAVLRNWKVKLLKENSSFFQRKRLFATDHNRWKHENYVKRHNKDLFRRFGIKRVIKKDLSEEWYGCTKDTQRCFGTIINDVAAFIYKGRWTPPCCLQNLRETTKHVLNIFEVYNIPYWLEGGSLLGAARSGDIIPWDYDVDIGMYRKDISKIPNLKKAEEGKKVVDEYGFVWEKSREGDFYRVQFSVNNHMHVDIFPFYEKNGIMTKDTWFKTHRQDTEFPAKYLQPLERMRFVGMDVLVPNNYRKFLEFKFGQGVIENPKYPDSRKV